jgi:transcriptional regulator with XRE-family HTH domain
MAASDLPKIYGQLGRRVKALREAAHWTQAKLAEEIGVDTSYMVKIEGGKRRIQLETLGDIALALGRPVAEFFPERVPTPATRKTTSAQELPSAYTRPRGTRADAPEIDDLVDLARELDREAVRSLVFIARRFSNTRR